MVCESIAVALAEVCVLMSADEVRAVGSVDVPVPIVDGKDADAESQWMPRKEGMDRGKRERHEGRGNESGNVSDEGQGIRR